MLLPSNSKRVLDHRTQTTLMSKKDTAKGFFYTITKYGAVHVDVKIQSHTLVV